MIGVKITKGGPDPLVEKMDTLAANMIDGLGESGIGNKVDVFSVVTKWVAVKNRLEKVEDDAGSQITAYRDALADTPSVGAVHRFAGGQDPAANSLRARTGKSLGRPRKAVAKRGTLASIKSRLPDANGGGDLGNGLDAFRAVSPPARGAGSVRSDVDDDTEPGLDEDNGQSDL